MIDMVGDRKAKIDNTVGNCCLQYDESKLEQVKVAVGD